MLVPTTSQAITATLGQTVSQVILGRSEAITELEASFTVSDEGDANVSPRVSVEGS